MHGLVIPFVAVGVSLLAVACTKPGAGPTPAARPGDFAYCQQLANQYTTYVGSVGGTLGGNVDENDGQPADLDASVAIAQCQEGNPGPAIPVLEKKLRDAKVAVPPRPK
jgi:hypothetical protein